MTDAAHAFGMTAIWFMMLALSEWITPASKPINQ